MALHSATYRDGELFDAKWVYICDATKATHFSEISAPVENAVELDAFGMRDGERSVLVRGRKKLCRATGLNSGSSLPVRTLHRTG